MVLTLTHFFSYTLLTQIDLSVNNVSDTKRLPTLWGEDFLAAARVLMPYFELCRDWLNPEHEYPSDDRWLDELRIIVTNVYEKWPGAALNVQTPAEVLTLLGDDRAAVDEAIRLIRDQIIGFMTWPMRPELNQFMTEWKSKDGRASQQLVATLAGISKPLISASELSALSDINASRVGRLMRAHGHKRVRISSHGENQYLWIIADHDKYAAMSAKELRAAWIGFNAPVVSFM